MKIYVDENVEEAVVEGLKRRGVNIWSARELGHLGKSDEFHLQYAKQMGAVLLTHDADLLSMAHRWHREGREHHGILYSHIRHLSIGECIRRVELVIRLLIDEEMRNHIEFL